MSPKFFLDNAVPREIIYTLLSIDSNEFLSKVDFETRFKTKDWLYGKRFFDNFNRLADLGIFEKSKKNYSLTHLGRTMKKVMLIDQDSFFELLHYLHYLKSALDTSREYFYTYRIITDMLYDETRVPTASKLLTRVIDKIQTKFGIEKIAIDGRSIGKTVAWIKAMGDKSPITNTNDILLRNSISYPQVILVALDFYYKFKGLKYGFPVLLDDETKKSLCHFCFITEICLDKSLNSLFSSGKVRRNFGTAGLSVILDSEIDFTGWVEETVL